MNKKGKQIIVIENKPIQSNLLLPSVAIITVIIAVLGWIFYRVEKNEDRVSEVEGNVREILEAVEWLKDKKDAYQKINENFDIQTFVSAILMEE